MRRSERGLEEGGRGVGEGWGRSVGGVMVRSCTTMTHWTGIPRQRMTDPSKNIDSIILRE